MSPATFLFPGSRQASTGRFGFALTSTSKWWLCVSLLVLLFSVSPSFGQGFSGSSKMDAPIGTGLTPFGALSKSNTLKDNSPLQKYILDKMQNRKVGQPGKVRVVHENKAKTLPFAPFVQLDTTSTFAPVMSKSLEEEDSPFCEVDYVWDASANIGEHTVSSNPLGFSQGTIDVSPTGAAVYSIPLWTSPGTNGMEPKLSVVYNSQSGVGLFSSKWTLGGLSSITRSSKNSYYDGVISPIKYTDEDAFSLDGQRLIPLGEEGEYCTDPESFSRIVHLLDGQGAISGFRVYTRDGSVLDYTDSFVLKAGHTISWRLSKVTDANGNYMDYYYSTPDGYGFSGISSIEYTGNNNVIQLPYNKVEFSYYSSDYTNWQYLGGDSIAAKSFINGITIYHDNTFVRQYAFEYQDFVSTSGVSDTYPRMTLIKEVGVDNCLIGLKHIEWGDDNAVSPSILDGHIFVQNTTFPTGSNPSIDNLKYFWGDFNGDGILDFITAPKKVIYGVGDISIFYAGTSGGLYREIRRDSLNKIGEMVVIGFAQGDFNGDGIEELLWIRDLNDLNGFQYILEVRNYKTGETKLVNLWNYYQNKELFFEDMDGDGTTEVLMARGVNDITYWDQIDLFMSESTDGSALIEAYGNLPLWNYSYCKFADFNGDGNPELVVPYDDSIYIYQREGSQYVLMSTLTLFIGDQILFGDFNGDGYTDIYLYQKDKDSGRTRMYMSTGTGFTYISEARLNNLNTKKYTLYVADIDGNGYSDIIRVGRINNTVWSAFYISYNLGSRYVDANTNVSGLDINIEDLYFDDFRRDGTMGIFYGKVNVQKKYNFYKNLSLRYVREIMNNQTDRIVITYAPLTQLSDYKRIYPGVDSLFLRPVQLFNIPLYVTRNIEHVYNTHSTRSTYGYSAGLFDGGGKGLLGFLARWSIEDSPYSARLFLSDYNPDYHVVYPKEDRIFLDSTWTSPIQSTAYTYTFQPSGFEYNSFKRHQLRPTSSLQRDFLTTNDYLTQYLDYDEISGSPTFVENYFYENTNSHGDNYQWKDKVEYSYRNDTSLPGWHLGMPMSKTVTLQKTVGSPTWSQQTIYERYDNGSLASETADGVAHIYNYDNFGHVASATIWADPIPSRTTYYSWDDQGRFKIQETNDLGQAFQTQYDSQTGDVVLTRDPLGVEITYGIDYYRRYRTQDSPGDNRISEVFWDVDGPPEAVFTSMTYSQQGKSVMEHFDNGGRLLRKAEVLGSYDYDACTDMHYDDLGRVDSTSYPFRYTEEPQEWKEYSYDDYGRLSQETTPWLTTAYGYSNNTVTTEITPGSNASQTYTKVKDSKGLLMSATDLGGTTSYQYNEMGKPISITSNSVETKMRYDNLGQQTAREDPNAGTTTYQYNLLGELIEQTDTLGNHFQMEYDNLGRMISKTGPEGTYTYIYDSYNYGQEDVSRPGLLMCKNFVSADSEVHNKVEYQYYPSGELISEKNTIDEESYTTLYGWNNWDMTYLESITYPDGFKVYQTHFANGDIYQVRRDTYYGNLLWEGRNGNILGQVTESKTGNTANTTLTTYKAFDAQGVLQSIRVRPNQGADKLHKIYVFDKGTGNLTSRRDSVLHLNETFQYDNLNRLTHASSRINGVTTADTIVYDNPGNITRKSGVGVYNYGANGAPPYAVTSVTNPQNAIPSLQQAISYNSFQKVDSIREGNKLMVFTYGVDQQRIMSRLYRVYGTPQTQTLLRTIVYVGDYEKETIADTTGSTAGVTISRDYIGGGDGLMAINVSGTGSQNGLYYIHRDHLGSFDVVTNSTGAVVQRTLYNPWGMRTLYNGTILFNRGFTGHEHLDEFGLINMNGRVYDPLLGRFLSPDNFVQMPDFTQSFNRYAYCINNPLKFADPSGEFFWFVACITIATSGAIMNTVQQGIAGNIHDEGDMLRSSAIGAASALITSGVGTLFSSSWGVVNGFASGFAAGFSSGAGNVWANGGSFSDGLKGGLIAGAIGGLVGGAVGLWSDLHPEPQRFGISDANVDLTDVHYTNEKEAALGYDETLNSFAQEKVGDKSNYGVHGLRTVPGGHTKVNCFGRYFDPGDKTTFAGYAKPISGFSRRMDVFISPGTMATMSEDGGVFLQSVLKHEYTHAYLYMAYKIDGALSETIAYRNSYYQYLRYGNFSSAQNILRISLTQGYFWGKGLYPYLPFKLTQLN